MNYVLDEKQYRKLIASIYMDLEYDNYKKSRIIRLIFGKKYNNLTRKTEKYPKAALMAERLQMRGLRDTDLVLTFDSNIKWWTDSGSAVGMSKGRRTGGRTAQLMPGRYIMGIRAPGGIPAWLSGGLEDAMISSEI
jgi:hypothetical protein